MYGHACELWLVTPVGMRVVDGFVASKCAGTGAEVHQEARVVLRWDRIWKEGSGNPATFSPLATTTIAPMFEDYCLTCGKELADDRAYCNEVCTNGDLTSPSLSSASSTFSSPHLAYAHGQDVPALVPSALGRALRAYTAHDRYSASSSSASSTSWSLVTDDDEDDLISERDLEGPIHLSHPAGLSYARRPSGTNNRSTFPRLHRRTDSQESTSLGCSFPQSAPSSARLCPPDDEDLDLDDPCVDDCCASDFASEDPARQTTRPHTATVTSHPTKARRKRNRASLPAYFSMLQIGTGPSVLPPVYPRSGASPISSSSGHSTLPMRPSPPTPRLSLMTGLAHAHALTAPPTAALEPATHNHTPRGRRRPHSRIACASSRSRSASRSPSPARRRDSDEKVADWSSALERGRAVRRNSSPPPLPAAALAMGGIARSGSGSGSGSGSRARTRGRARVEELDGPRSPEHPGLGHGRSGLVGRARRGADWTPIGVGAL
ncbi:hypothetical protein DFH09DRAFT_1072088 [Mycena vulgaris]|nr:hypothetical protein DFH09DRAFT_1072088 [Mycena vulgaris]